MPSAGCSRRGLLGGLLVVAEAVALGACTLPSLPGLLRDLAQPLPAWVFSSPRSVRAYRAALAAPALMAALPCYCGCVALRPAHASLLDCFVQPNGALDQHAAGCEVCQREALDARALAEAHTLWPEIRRQIDDRYRDHGPPTGTPLPT
jgi:hypothetical protein